MASHPMNHIPLDSVTYRTLQRFIESPLFTVTPLMEKYLDPGRPEMSLDEYKGALHELIATLDFLKCAECDGDGGITDVMFHRIDCEKCHGSGMVPELPQERII